MNNKIFISHADIILDKIYDSNFNLIKQDGSGCNWNDLYNLSLMGETCYAFGSCGNDKEGKIALDSLKRVGVNTDNVLIDDTIRTDVMNILLPASSSLDDNDVIHTWYSPITNKSTMHFSDNLPLDIPEDFKDKEIYIILDKFENINYEFLQKKLREYQQLDLVVFYLLQCVIFHLQGHYRFLHCLWFHPFFRLRRWFLHHLRCW